MEKVAQYVFIDQHKKTSCIGIGDDKGHLKRRFSIEHEPGQIEWFKEQMRSLGRDVVVGLEATGFYDWMVDVLQEQPGVEVKLGHPLAMKYISKAKNKTDGKDVERGLKLLGTEQFPESYLPSALERQMRFLLSVREGMFKMRGQARNRIWALLNKHNIRLPQKDLEGKKSMVFLKTLELPETYRRILDELLAMLAEISRRQEGLDREVERLVEGDEVARWWWGHKGVGATTALALRAYVADPGRFTGRRTIASYLGLSPRVHNSAETIQHGGIDRQGPPIVRRLLMQVVHVLVQHVPEVQAYHSYLSQRRGKRRAYVAVARKFVVGLHAAWRHKQDFDWAKCFKIPGTAKVLATQVN